MRVASPNCYRTPVPVRPKKKCCQDKPRCKRCPIRLLAEGRLAPEDARTLFADARNKKALKKAKLGKNAARLRSAA
jgi:hypothetical protein